MSWRATSWAAEQVTGSPITKLVLLKLADNANDEGTCWPSVPLIAEHTELSERTVQQHLGRLESLGLVRIERRQQGGVHLPNIFHLAIAPPARRGKGGGAGDSPPPQRAHQGGAPAAPGGESGDIAYKDEPPIEPTKEPLTNAPAGAREGIHALGQEDLTLWPVFRDAIASTWPDGFPASNELACKTEFGKATRLVSGDQLVACARLHGQALHARQKDRPKSAGKLLAKAPANWLRSGEWQGYLVSVDQARQAEAQLTSAIGRVRRGLGPELFDWLRHDRGMGDAALAALDGATFEGGADPVILVTSNAGRILLDRHLYPLQRKFGEALRIQQVAHVRSA